MKNASFLVALAFMLSACATKNEQADPKAPADEAVVLTAEDRPDANNPVLGDDTFPAGWEVRLDSPNEELVIAGDTTTIEPDIWFTSMTPGWHVTMRSPRAIFWHPASTAEGDYSVTSNIFLFEPGTRNEGYGLFVGGSDLSGENQSYTYFLLRRSGEFLVKLRNGSETETVEGWTPHEAIVPWSDDAQGTISNILGVKTEGDTISFLVNDTVVHSMDKGSIPTDGVIGFRFNHAINVHVSTFDVTS